jgi:hypothetical protein
LLSEVFISTIQKNQHLIFKAMTMKKSIWGGILLVWASVFAACQKDANDPTNPNNAEVPEVYKKIYGVSDMYVEGTNLVIKTSGRPDHKSPYYKDTQWNNTLYEAYNGSNANFILNPNRIATQNYTFKIPLNPAVNNAHPATPSGAMGVSLNGVPFFNQYAAMNAPLTNEIDSFDQYGGHPQQQGGYHYHIEPFYLTTQKGKSVLLGFLLDGFPVYGPLENGKTLKSSDLDVYHGHSHATTDYPNGIYHYHITADSPYLNGSGFYGTPGTVSQ